MSFLKLSYSGALAEGARLWVAPQPEMSSWAAQIDWFLNLQHLRWSSYKGKELSPELNKILEGENMQIPSKKSPEHFFVSSKNKLPSEACVFLNFNGDKNNWQKKLESLWTGLGEPSLRVFLPISISHQEFADLDWCYNFQNRLKVGVVEDSIRQNH